MATIIGTSGSDTNLTGTGGSDKINAGAGDDTLIYNLTANMSGTKDIYTGGSGVDTVLLEMSYAQWIGYQSEISRYLTHLDTVKKNLNGEVSNGSSSDFTFVFGSSTLTVQMMEVLRVKVDVKGDGNFVEMNLANEVVTAVNDLASAEVDTPNLIYVLNNDSVPDLVKNLAFVDPMLLTYGTATLEKPASDNASTWYFKYSVGTGDEDYIALGGGVIAPDSFKYKVTDADGSEGTATVTITVTGANDLATILDATPDGVNDDFKGEVTEAGSVNEGVNPTATGKLTVVDPDNGESTFLEAVDLKSSKGYGIFSIKESGEWTYKLDNDNEVVKALTTNGPPEEDTFTVSSLDGTATKTVTITIKGADDVVPLVANQDVLWVTTNTVVTLSTAVLLKNDAGGDKTQLIVTTMTDETALTNLFLTNDGSFSFYSVVRYSPVVDPLLVTPEDGSLPGPGSSGGAVASPIPYTFTYTVKNTDTGQSVVGSVTVNLLPVSPAEANIWDLSDQIYDGAYLAGGSASDTFRAGNGETVMVADENDVIYGGPGIDTIFLALSSPRDFTAPDKVENVTLTTPGNNFSFEGNNLNNILNGSDASETLKGGYGNDTLYGMGGGDMLVGGDGDDYLEGGDGKDLLMGGSGNNTMKGGAGQDWFEMKPNGFNTIGDFSSSDSDLILIRKSDFGFGLGSEIVVGFYIDAPEADLDGFYYNSTSGMLFFGKNQLALIGGESEHPVLTSDLALESRTP